MTYYDLNYLDINEKTRIIISLHQEDERIQGVVTKRPYLDVGFKKLIIFSSYIFQLKALLFY